MVPGQGLRETDRVLPGQPPGVWGLWAQSLHFEQLLGRDPEGLLGLAGAALGSVCCSLRQLWFWLCLNIHPLSCHWQDPQTSRTLTLVSKTIQTLGSLSKSKSVSC